MTHKEYDLITIGAGSGGLGISLAMLELGFKPLLIDESPKRIGGECLNTGCIPSKALLHVAKIIHNTEKAKRFGVNSAGSVSIDKVLQYVRNKQDHIRKHENIKYLQKKGIKIVLGTARFSSVNSVTVDDKKYRGKKFVIATGSAPKTVDVKGLDSVQTYTNENIFNIDFIPDNFIFIGAGPVSIELGQAFSRLGSKVTIIDRGSHILKKEDPVISDVLHQKLKEENITFYFKAELDKIVSGAEALLKFKEGRTLSIPVNAIFMGIGRALNFDSLQLKKAGIQTENGTIKLNKKLQTTNKRVFVSGDAADNLKFSHAAEMHNTLLLNNFLSPLKKKLNLEHFPWVTFTDPEIATFGLNEKRLKEKNIAYEKLEMDFSEIDRAVTDDYQYGKMILYIEKKRFNISAAKILGGSMVAPNAGEIFQELLLANSSGISVKEILNKIYPYPTAANAHKKILRDRMIKEIRPWMKQLIKWVYKI